MESLTEKMIRASFVNCSRREAADVTLPNPLSDVKWDRIDYLGWIDRKAPLRSYVVLPVDDAIVGIALRAPEAGGRRSHAICAWCEDVYTKNNSSLYVARRSGAAGRKGDTIGTLICTTFDCSRNVRRPPTMVEAGQDPEGVIARRIDGLRERSLRFAREILREV